MQPPLIRIGGVCLESASSSHLNWAIHDYLNWLNHVLCTRNRPLNTCKYTLGGAWRGSRNGFWGERTAEKNCAYSSVLPRPPKNARGPDWLSHRRGKMMMKMRRGLCAWSCCCCWVMEYPQFERKLSSCPLSRRRCLNGITRRGTVCGLDGYYSVQSAQCTIRSSLAC